MKMENQLTPTESGLIVHDRLPERHPYHRHLEKALRSALRELPGSWEVSIIPVGRRLFNIEVVAPDTGRWSVSVPVPEGPRAEDVAEMVRAACIRRCSVKEQTGTPLVTDMRPRTAPAKANVPSRSALLEPATPGRGSR